MDAHGVPLFEIQPIAWRPPSRNTFDALLLGSANAVRHAGPALAAYRGKPAYAVGATTAEVAREAGLKVVASGAGGLKSLLPLLLPEHRRLLRLSGRERMTLTPPRGVSIQERVVYASEPLPMPPVLRRLLARPAVVLLHSAEAAHHFAEQCEAARLPRGLLKLAALGARIARAADGGWAAVASAEFPSDAALLALAGQMCQDPAG
jgi:uroporphyrinogen-III synthase